MGTKAVKTGKKCNPCRGCSDNVGEATEIMRGYYNDGSTVTQVTQCAYGSVTKKTKSSWCGFIEPGNVRIFNDYENDCWEAMCDVGKWFGRRRLVSSTDRLVRRLAQQNLLPDREPEEQSSN